MKDMYPDEMFEDIQKKDGYIALIFYLIYFGLSFFYIDLFKDYMHNEKILVEVRRLVLGIGFYLVPLIAVLIILKLRKQKLSTIGFRKKSSTISFGIGLMLVAIVFIIFILKDHPIDFILYNFIFYVLILGFSEEIIFRGFIWPRFVVLLGKTRGTFLSGALFGIIHAPIKIVIGGHPFMGAIAAEIGGGIVGSLFFIFIYIRSKNIILPSMIHGAFDFLSGIFV